MKVLYALSIATATMFWSLTSCTQKNNIGPVKIIDLSPTITEDMKVRLMGHAIHCDLGVLDSVRFIHLEDTVRYYSINSYITLYNHAGPHADSPLNLIRDGATIADYKLDQFYGHAKLLDYSNRSWQSLITMIDLKKYKINRGDIIIVYVGFKIPKDPNEFPAYTALTPKAAKYLAELQIKAYATDAPEADNLLRSDILYTSTGETDIKFVAPVHHAFLSNNIPVIEGLCNIEELIPEKEIFFVGFPLKTTGKAGDAAPMRAAALIY